LVSRVHRYEWTALSCLVRHAPGIQVSPRLEQVFRRAHHVASWPIGSTNESGTMVCLSANVPAESAPRFLHAGAGMDELQRLGFAGAGLDLLHPVGPWITLSARDVVMRRYFRGRLVFIGDAAHSLSPQLGQGARLALAGAANLAAALERHPVADALAAYDRCQRNLAARFQYWSRWLTPVFQSQGRGALWIRDRVLPSLARLAPIERELSRLLCGPAEEG
jgi:2-polyprenyl-6-methoxyphenol hydroxylase-like FAD-dependent oxidoreductase